MKTKHICWLCARGVWRNAPTAIMPVIADMREALACVLHNLPPVHGAN